MIKYMLITNHPAVAHFAASIGVDRIFVDLELRGKIERQGHLSTVISRHSMDDVARVREAIPGHGLLVRLNPLWDGTADEVEKTVALGADILMLPMFRTAAEVESFVAIVAGRARVIPLVETAAASSIVASLARIDGVDELFFGLNDLHLDLGLPFMFSPLAYGLVEAMSVEASKRGVPFGFGGVARVGEGDLSGELVLAEHVRLGSSSVILSRTFMRDFQPGHSESETALADEIAKLRREEVRLELRGPAERESDRQRVSSAVRMIEGRLSSGR